MARPPARSAGGCRRGSRTVPRMSANGVSLTILMPVYNERDTIAAAIEDALGAELPVASRQLIVVDDGSTDGTRQWLTSTTLPDAVELVLHDANKGKGAAIRTALEHATGDLLGDPRRRPRVRRRRPRPVLEPLLAGKAHVVFGTGRGRPTSSFSFWYVMGNKAVTFATNLLYNCWISDVMTCHKAMSTELFRSLRLRSAASRSSPRSPRGCSSRASGSTRCRSATRPAPATRARS